MNFLMKSKYARYSRKFHEIDYVFENLKAQCQKDIEEMQYLPLSEHHMAVCKVILKDICSKCDLERERIEKGFKIIEEATKSDEKGSIESGDALRPLRRTLNLAQLGVTTLKNAHKKILSIFKNANIKEKTAEEKIHRDEEEQDL